MPPDTTECQMLGERSYLQGWNEVKHLTECDSNKA